MVVTRKVRTKKDEPTTSTASEAAGEVVEKVVPDVDESMDDGNPGEESTLEETDVEGLEESKENIKEEAGEDDGTGKRVPKPSFKVKYANQKLTGNFTAFDGDFSNLAKELRVKTLLKHYNFVCLLNKNLVWDRN